MLFKNKTKAVFFLITLVGVAMLYNALSGNPKESTGVTIGGDFVLTDQNGKTVQSADFKGRIMLVFFGFTHCPEVCPVTLSTMDKTLDLLGEKAKQVAPIFITVDPERDTSAVMKRFLASFDSSIIGLTGSEPDIKKVSDAYKIYAAKSEVLKKDGDYLVDHSSIVYMMDRDGKYLRHFSYNTSEKEMAAAIVEYLK